MQWLSLLTASGQPAIKPGEEVLFACFNPKTRDRCMVLGRIAIAVDAKGMRAHRAGQLPLKKGQFLQSTWDGRPIEAALVPYAFARPVPPEPK